MMLDLLSILDQKVSQTPEKLAYIFLKDRENQEQRITYQQLSQISKRIAVKLQSLIPSGARALLLYPQGLEFITAFLGCLYVEVIAVPAYPPKRNQKISRLIAIIEDSQPQIILTTRSLLENIQPKLEDFLDLSVTQFLATDNLNDNENFEFSSPDVSGNTLTFLQYTSGSTGSPKGVMISHDNIAHNSVYIQKAFQLTQKSVSVTWLPSFHDMGLIDGIIQPLYTGFLGVVMSPESFLKNPILCLQAITKYRATHSGGPNLGYELCVRRITAEQQKSIDLSSWVSAYNGAEPIRRKTLDSFINIFSFPSKSLKIIIKTIQNKLQNILKLIKKVIGTYEHRPDVPIKSLMQTYTPKIYLGRVLFFKARELFSISRKVEQPEVNLQKLVMGNLEIHEIPGNHESMLKEPHVKVLAEKLASHLAKSSPD